MTDAFRHRTTLQVRFRDIDAFGHVNNAVFFSYLELARIRYLLEVLQPGEPIQRLPLILARVELDFRSPIAFGEDVVVETRVDHVGRTSSGWSHRMTAGPDGRLVGDVQTVLVTYDYETSRLHPGPRRLARSGSPRTRADPSRTDAPRPRAAAAS